MLSMLSCLITSDGAASWLSAMMSWKSKDRNNTKCSLVDPGKS
jgi:hypothetical protein